MYLHWDYHFLQGCWTLLHWYGYFRSHHRLNSLLDHNRGCRMISHKQTWISPSQPSSTNWRQGSNAIELMLNFPELGIRSPSKSDMTILLASTSTAWPSWDRGSCGMGMNTAFLPAAAHKRRLLSPGIDTRPSFRNWWHVMFIAYSFPGISVLYREANVDENEKEVVRLNKSNTLTIDATDFLRWILRHVPQNDSLVSTTR